MAKTNKTYVGTELKMHIGFSYPADNTITLDTLDNVIVEFFCNKNQVQTFTKEQLIREPDGQYYAPVDTTRTGSGQLKMKMTVEIPDNAFPDGYRTEIGICTTNVIIE